MTDDHIHYMAERIGRARFYLLERSDKFPLHTRLERAFSEGFSPGLDDWFPDSLSELREEWLAIQAAFVHAGRVNVTVGLMSEQELEALEERVLAFIDRYLTAHKQHWSEQHSDQ